MFFSRNCGNNKQIDTFFSNCFTSKMWIHSMVLKIENHSTIVLRIFLCFDMLFI